MSKQKITAYTFSEVYKIKHLRNTLNGNAVWEVTTNKGVFQTKPNSQVGCYLSSCDYTNPRLASVTTEFYRGKYVVTDVEFYRNIYK